MLKVGAGKTAFGKGPVVLKVGAGKDCFWEAYLTWSLLMSLGTLGNVLNSENECS